MTITISEQLNRHILYCISNDYAKYCSVSIYSLLQNNLNCHFVINIFTDYLSDKSYRLLSEVTNRFDAELKIHIIDDSNLFGLGMQWSKYAWYRILVTDYISKTIDRVLYLDCDVIINGNIQSLFNLELKGKMLAAVPDLMDSDPKTFERVGYSAKKGYFCSGVMIINLNYFRQKNLSYKILDFARKKPERLKFPDQDVLNIFAQNDKILLPLKYGVLSWFNTTQFVKKYSSEIIDSLENPVIIHYAGCAPWIIEHDTSVHSTIFWKYANEIKNVKPIHAPKGVALFKLYILKLLDFLHIPGYRYNHVKRPTLAETKQHIFSILSK